MAFPSRERFDEICAAFSGRRILVIGDLMLDRYLWGDTTRISPEAPVPVIEARDETLRLGGAANVAHNVSSLGATSILVGVRGDDAFGAELARTLEERGIETQGVVSAPDRRTTTKTRVLARNQQVVRIDREDTSEVSGSTQTSLIEAALRGLRGAHACVISDYGKGVISRQLLEHLLPEAARLGIPVAVDPKETHFFAYRGVATITPNQLEAGAAYGRRIRDMSTLLAAGAYLREELDAGSVLVTRGGDGMTLFMEGRRPLHFPALAREVFDVTGAGDTVVSSFAVALSAGASLPEAAAISNHAAGLVVREVGTAVTTVAALRATFLQSGVEDDPFELDPTRAE